MTTITLSAARLDAFLDTLIAKRTSDPNAQQCALFYVCFGTSTPNTPDNQRGAAILQYLFDLSKYVENTAMFVALSPLSSAEPSGTVAVSVTIVTDQLTVVVPQAGALKENRTVTVEAGSQIAQVAARLRDQLKADSSSAPSLGAPFKELAIQSGAFAESALQAINETLSASSSGVAQIESGPFLGSLLFDKKDDVSLGSVVKACGLCVGVVRRFAKGHMEQNFTKPVPSLTSAEFETMIAHKLEHPNELEGMGGIDFTDFAMSLYPRVMHTATYESSLTKRVPSDAVIQPNVVVMRLAAKHNGVCGLMARSYIFEKNAPKHASETYEAIAAIHAKTMEELSLAAQHNTSNDTTSNVRRLCDVYANVLTFATATYPAVVPFLGKSLGYMTGLLICEPRGTINEKATEAVMPRSAYVVRTFVDKLVPSVTVKAEDAAAADGEQQQQVVSIEIADTLIIGDDGQYDIKTKMARGLQDITYKIEDEEEGGDDDEPAVQRNLRAITRAGQGAVPTVSRAEEREDNLKKLYREKHAEWIANGRKSDGTVDVDAIRTQTVGQLALGDISPYGDHTAAPEGLGPNMLRVHAEKKVAWMPVAGVPTPFHISTIARLESIKEGPQTRLTVVFHSSQESNVAFKQNRTKVFVRELSFVAPSESAFADFSRQVLEIQAAIKQQDLDRKQNQGLAKQAGLKLIGGARRLPNVKIRPPPAAGKHGVAGNVEAHSNGLRFSSMTAAPVDILYSNVKHFIFQPSNNTIATFFHVTLKLPILVGKKKTDEISFFAEVMEASEAVDGPSRMDAEREIEREERENARVKETNREFALFSRAVEEASQRQVNTPLSHFTFDGVPHRGKTQINGSQNVIWGLADLPPFTLNLAEVELLAFERVVHSGANFDLKFILKNHDKPPVSIDTIDMSALDIVKDWALQAKLYYTEFRINLQWPRLLKESRADPDWEPYGEGGFCHLNGHAEDSDEESDEDTDDESYHESSDEESDEDYDDSDDEFDASDDSDASGSADNDSDSDAESDVSWDEMDRRAEREDHKRRLSDDDSDSDRGKRKKPRVEAAGRGGRGGPAVGRGGVGMGRGAAAPPPRAPLGKFAATKGPVAPSAMPRVGVKGSAPPPRRF